MANFSLGDPRFQSFTNPYPFSTGQQVSTSSSPFFSAPTCSADPSYLSPQPLSSLMSSPSFAPSNTYSASPLLDTQASTAASITNPSEDEGAGVDGRKVLKGTSVANGILKELTSKGARAGSGLGRASRVAGPVLGIVGSSLAVPSAIALAGKSIDKAVTTGDGSDIAQAVANTSDATSKGLSAVGNGLNAYQLGHRLAAGHKAGKAAEAALRQSAPNASKSVISATRKEASKMAIDQLQSQVKSEIASGKASKLASKAAGKAGTSRAAKAATKASGKAAEAAAEVIKDKAVRRGVTAAATNAAKGTGNLARGAGVAGRSAAKVALREGGEAAAKAATKAVAKSGLKTAAKTAARFAPGLNIAIAAADGVTMAATLADPKASTGKKVTSVITAIGSAAAATNIPVVSQVGAVVSGVSDFIGSFF